MILSPAQVDAYRRDGYIGAIDVIDGRKVNSYREAFDDLEARVGKETAQIGLVDYHFEGRVHLEACYPPNNPGRNRSVGRAERAAAGHPLL